MNFQNSQDNLLSSILNQSYEIEVKDTAPLDQDSENGLINEEDRLILMHRDAHFGGNFAIMLDYYAQEKKGAVLDADLKRLRYLQQQEVEQGKNLAALLLSGADAEKVQVAKKMYAQLREALHDSTNKITKEVIELILTEEEDYEKACQPLLDLGQAAIPQLIGIIKSDALQDPLFPGYGKAPLLAAFILGKLKATAAIEPLFQLLLKGESEYEEVVAQALCEIGSPAEDFLLRLVKQTPINKLNEYAATTLLLFNDAKISSCFLELLKVKEIRNKIPFACYLVYGCELLPPEKQVEFRQIAQDPETAKIIAQEMELTIKNWDKK